MKEQKRLGVGKRINVSRNPMYENDAKKFWTKLNMENVNKNVCHVHSANDFDRQFCMNFNSKCYDDVVNIASFKESTCKENVTV